MKRSMMLAYVTRSDEAVALYQKAFGTILISSYLNDDGTYFHSELDIEGEILAIAERNSEYAIIGEETAAKILMPLAPCEYRSLMADFIDKYGIRWCLFVQCGLWGNKKSSILLGQESPKSAYNPFVL